MRPARKDAKTEALKMAKAWIEKAHHLDKCYNRYQGVCDCGRVVVVNAINDILAESQGRAITKIVRKETPR